MLKKSVFLAENLILYTCNRVEIHAAAASGADYIGSIKIFLSKFHNLSLLDYENAIYFYKDNAAIEHLFKVASIRTLNSAVLKVLIIGAGAVGEKLFLCLKKNGVKSIFVTNRTLEKARDLAAKFCASAVFFENFKNSLNELDIIISFTAAPHSIIRKDDILYQSVSAAQMREKLRCD